MDPSLRAEAADALRKLIEWIVVMPDAEGRGSAAVLEGDLAKLLCFAAAPNGNARAVGTGGDR